MAKLFSRAKMSSATTGTGTLTLGSAVSNFFFTFAEAGVANGNVVAYVIEDGTDFEFGIGTYTSSGTTLSRDTVRASKIGGVAGTTKINCSGSQIVYIDAAFQDIQSASEPQNASTAWIGPRSGAAAAPTFRSIVGSDLPAITWRNILMSNGGFELWQRGSGDTSSIAVAASTTAYTADRWYLTTGANQACTVAAVTGLTSQSQFGGQVTRNSGQTGTGVLTFGFPLTKDECIRLRGQKITLQTALSTGANWSPTSGTLTFNVYFGTSAEAKRGAGFTGETNPLTGSVNVTAGTTGNIGVSSAGAVATNVTQGEVQFTWTPVGTAGAVDSITFDDVQLEPGDAGSPIERPSFSQMLRECSRHFAKSFPYNTAPAQNAGLADSFGGCFGGSANIYTYWRFPVQMRASPTITTFNPSVANANWRDVTGAADVTVSVDPNSAKGADGVLISATAGTATSHFCYIHATADAGI